METCHRFLRCYWHRCQPEETQLNDCLAIVVPKREIHKIFKSKNIKIGDGQRNTVLWQILAHSCLFVAGQQDKKKGQVEQPAL